MGKLVSGRQALVVGTMCLAVLFLWPQLGTMGAKVPSSLVAVIVGMIMVPLFGMNVSTIGDFTPSTPACPSCTYRSSQSICCATSFPTAKAA